MNFHDDGTPKSTGNAFDMSRFTVDPEQAKKKAKAKKIYQQKLARRGLTQADMQKKSATRKNPPALLGSFVPKSVRAPR